MTISGPVSRIYLAAFLAAAVTAGCSSGSEAGGDSGVRDGGTSADLAAAPAPGGCRVTLGNGSVPPGEQRPPGARNDDYFGNGRLWTALGSRGLITVQRRAVRRDGSIEMKFPWWRGVRGKLKITGRRLYVRAPRLRADIPRGYGPIGFQSTALTFPTKGCWKVTGRVGNARLTFVTLVRVKRSPGTENG